MPDMHSEPNINAFSDELANLVNKLFPGLHEDLQWFVADQTRSTDEFTFDIVDAFEYNWEDDPIQAVRDAVQHFTDTVRDRLPELFGDSSILPDLLMHVGATEDYVSQLISAASMDIDLSAKDEDFQALFSAAMLGLVRSSTNPHVSFGAILNYFAPVPEGSLVAALYHPWRAIIDELRRDWSLAYKIPPHRWEELIAGAFEQAGYDEVILTPKSGDFGRDVIATRKGVGCIRILGSVKAYAPNNKVKHDDVRALAGVLHGDQSASKGILMTTSSFAPLIATDPFISPLMPYRLELMDGKLLRSWLIELFNRKS